MTGKGDTVLKKVLVAEDEEALRMLIADSLEELELELDVAEDGEIALAKIDQNAYDLIILDYMMPKLTGIDVLRRMDVRAKQSSAILMLTAKAQESDKQTARSAGAHYFMPKPFSPIDLIAAVKEMLWGRSGGGTPG